MPARFLLAAGGVGNTKLPKETKKPFRETINPLKNLKIAKSAVFEAQGYQGVSKTHDFAGETNSFRFRFVWAVFRFARNRGATVSPKGLMPRRPETQKAIGLPQARKNLQKPLIRAKSFFRLVSL